MMSKAMKAFIAALLLLCWSSSNGTLATNSTNNNAPALPKKKELRKILICIVGTRGDITPLVAVGVALKEKGYRVRVHTSTRYVPFITELGLEAVGAYPDPISLLKSDPLLIERMDRGNPLLILSSLRDIMTREAPKAYKIIEQDGMDYYPDLVITSFLSDFLGWYAALIEDTPYIHVALYSLMYDPNHMQFGLPKLPFGLHYYLIRDGILSMTYYLFREFDKISGKQIMKKISRLQFTESLMNPIRPVIMLMSPLFAKYLAPDSPPSVKIVGNTVVGAQDQVNNEDDFGGKGITAKLQQFIDAGDNKPVYIGWGSMVADSPGFMAELAVRAVHQSKQRAILLGGYAKMDRDALEARNVEREVIQYAEENVMFVEAAPHEWLFPRVACTIHHGGIGTTASALRASVPTVITPIIFDNYDNSYLVREMGVGIGFKQKLSDITAKELGDAITSVLGNETMAKNAKEVGAQLLQEDGASEAAVQVEAFWEEYVVTGRFFEEFPGKEPTNYPYLIVQWGSLLLFLWFASRRVLFAQSPQPLKQHKKTD